MWECIEVRASIMEDLGTMRSREKWSRSEPSRDRRVGAMSWFSAWCDFCSKNSAYFDENFFVRRVHVFLLTELRRHTPWRCAGRDFGRRCRCGPSEERPTVVTSPIPLNFYPDHWFGSHVYVTNIVFSSRKHLPLCVYWVFLLQSGIHCIVL